MSRQVGLSLGAVRLPVLVAHRGGVAEVEQVVAPWATCLRGRRAS
jgi:hypothetical protein